MEKAQSLGDDHRIKSIYAFYAFYAFYALGFFIFRNFESGALAKGPYGMP